MRASHWLIAAATLCSILPGCAVAPPDQTDEATDDRDDALSDAGGLTVVQCNPYFAGRYAHPDRTLPIDYITADRFAESIASEHARTSLIGMEEMLTQADTDHVLQRLSAHTKRPWNARFYQMKAGQLGVTIFWRIDVLTPVQDFGIKVLDLIDKTDGPQKSYGVPFGGMLFQMNGTDRQVAFYAGKLIWEGTHIGGKALDAAESDVVRTKEANELMAWIDSTTSQHPKATRVIAMDGNTSYDSAPRYRLRLHFIDGEDSRGTFEQNEVEATKVKKRLDYVFWDYDAGKKRDDGILAGPVVSGDFGSDHRYVATRVYVRSASE